MSEFVNLSAIPNLSQVGMANFPNQQISLFDIISGYCSALDSFIIYCLLFILTMYIYINIIIPYIKNNFEEGKFKKGALYIEGIIDDLGMYGSIFIILYAWITQSFPWKAKIWLFLLAGVFIFFFFKNTISWFKQKGLLMFMNKVKRKLEQDNDNFEKAMETIGKKEEYIDTNFEDTSPPDIKPKNVVEENREKTDVTKLSEYNLNEEE